MTKITCYHHREGLGKGNFKQFTFAQETVKKYAEELGATHFGMTYSGLMTAHFKRHIEFYEKDGTQAFRVKKT